MLNYFGSSPLLERYSGVLTHQLNNDLTLIQGSASILQAGYSGGEAKLEKSIERILFASNRAAAMLRAQRALLKHRDPNEPLDVEVLVQELAAFLAPFAKESGTEVKLEIQSGLGRFKDTSGVLLRCLAEGIFWIWEEAARTRAIEVRLSVTRDASQSLGISLKFTADHLQNPPSQLSELPGFAEWKSELSKLGTLHVFSGSSFGWEWNLKTGIEEEQK